MANLSTNILILFGISAALAFFFPLVRDGVLKGLSLKGLGPALLPFAFIIVPFAALFGLGAFLQLPVSTTLPCFAGAAILSFLLARTGMPSSLRGVLLLVASFALTWFLNGEVFAQGIAAAILGLITAKIADNLLFADITTYDDVLTPIAWLGGTLWLHTNSSSGLNARDTSILLGTISICLLLRIFERPFMTDDRWLVKRVVLAATGGLAALLVITKLVLAPDFAKLALLIGGGMFATYLFQNIDTEGEDKISATAGIQMLIVIGVLTLVAERFFGMYGLLLLVPAALLPPRSGFAQYAGLYFVSRVLLQAFVLTYNSNVTGINVTHAYTGAALYAGFIAMAILFVLLREVVNPRGRCALFLAAGALIPIGANYYLHAEPTSSLLVAATVAAVMLAVLGPALQRNAAGYGNLLLVPSMMAVSGITYGGLIEAGVSASNETRLIILGCAVGAVLVALLVSWFISRQPGGKKPLPAASE